MVNSKKLTALEVVGDRGFVASNSAQRRKDACEDWKEASKVDMKSYALGEAAAYNDARKIMEAELRRLCNLFQNGALSIDAFGITL